MLMTLILKSPVLFTFLLMIVPFTDQYILKVIPFLNKKIYSSCRSGQIHGKWHSKCKLLHITYRKSSVVKYVYNMYQANSLSDDNSPLLTLFADKHLGFTVPTTDFIHMKETQHESYLGVIISNKLRFDQHKATNLLSLCCCNLHMCSKEVDSSSSYYIIVHPQRVHMSIC